MNIDDVIEIYKAKYHRTIKEKDELVKEHDYHHAHELLIKIADYYDFVNVLEEVKRGLVE